MRLAPRRPPTKRRASFSSAFAISGPAPPEGMNPRLRPMWRTPRRPGRPHPDPSSAPARGIRARLMASRGRPRSGSAPRNQIAHHHTGCPRQRGSIVQSPWSLVPACARTTALGDDRRLSTSVDKRRRTARQHSWSPRSAAADAQGVFGFGWCLA